MQGETFDICNAFYFVLLNISMDISRTRRNVDVSVRWRSHISAGGISKCTL